MRATIAILAAILVSAIAPPLRAQSSLQEAARWCTDGAQAPDARIDGCTRAIESGQFTGRDLSALYANRAAVHRRMGALERAEEDVTEALRLNPANDVALTIRGNVHSNLQLFEQAIVDYSQAIKVNPGRWEAYTGRALAQYASGNYDLAIQDWNKVIGRSPNANAFTDRANAFYMLGQYDRALQDYDRALKIDPSHADAQKYRAETLKKLGR